VIFLHFNPFLKGEVFSKRINFRKGLDKIKEIDYNTKRLRNKFSERVYKKFGKCR